MAEGRRIEINVPADMEANYPDSVSSSPRSRETDPDYFGGSTNQRWDPVDNSSTGSSSTRVRLMCSCGGKILPRPHDNQLAYVGGDTRILAVDRSIRFGTIISKLSAVWGSGVSFKYQLPNEDLDSLISVTNDEDLDNMMAEYDRLQKSGYKFSRLRLFVFNRGADGSSSSLGSVMEDTRREQWFVEALNNPPVNQGVSNRSDGGSGSEASAWVNNMPDYLFGLENNNPGVRNNGGAEEDRLLPRPSSFDSDASGSNSNRGQIGANPNPNPVPDQSENSISAQKGAARISNSAPIQEIPAPPKPNLQPEVSDTIAQRPQMPQHVPLQEFQNLQLKHQQQEHQLKQQDQHIRQQDQHMQQQEQQWKQQDQHIRQQDQHMQQQEQQWKQQDQHIRQQDQQIKQQEQHQDSMQEAIMNLPGRKVYPDPSRAINLSSPGQEVYMQQQQQQQSQGDYYRPEPQQQQQQQPPQGDYYRHEPQQQQQQQQPPQGDYYRHEPQQQPVTYWQMHDQVGAGNGQYPVYMMPSGSNMVQTMTGVRPSPGYYNPAQRVTAAPSVYDAPGLTSTVRGTVPRQQQIGGVSEAELAAAEAYREQQQQQQNVVPLQGPPVSKVPAMYASPMQVPVAGDMRMMYRPTPPVNSMPIAHPESYGYPAPPQQVVYDPNLGAARQMYYTQAVNTQYHQPMGPIASDVNAAVPLDMSAAPAPAPEQQVKLGRVSPATS